MSTRLGVDVGGTFTDLAAVVDGHLVLAKVPSVPVDQARGVLAVVERSGIDPRTVDWLAHGSTVATNALLERRGTRTALVTTEGFRDILEIGRQDRPALYDLTRDRPAALVPRSLRFVVRERCGPEGVLTPLDEESVRDAASRMRAAGVESVAVCLLFSFLHPAHERRVGEILADLLPEIPITLSSEVLPESREYERTSTTVADAYLTPRLSSYLHSLAAGARRVGLAPPLVMQSSGGVVELEVAAAHAAACVLSGPAGGVVGGAYVAGLSGVHDLLTFDMGGTSTDVATVLDGRVQTTTEAVIAGVPLQLPMVDVHTVSAGGGSIAWADEGGALRVGPESAGAEPGPAAYQRGGELPTVTDANLHLGYLPDGARLGGDVTLAATAARDALERLGDAVGLPVDEVAAGVVAVADAEMVRALRVITVERGLDPRDLSLVAFGGAGGMHACSLAEEMGMTRVLVPYASGVLSALGLAVGDLRRDYSHARLGVLADLTAAEVEAEFAELAAAADRDLPGATLARAADCRYAGQSFELTVAVDDSPDGDGLLPGIVRAFGAAHEQRHGYRMDDEPVELVAVRLTATIAGERPKITAPPADPEARAGRRTARIDGAWVEVDVLPRAALGPGDEVVGPAIVEFGEATCVVRPGWAGRVDDVGTLVLARSATGGE